MSNVIDHYPATGKGPFEKEMSFYQFSGDMSVLRGGKAFRGRLQPLSF